MNKFEKLSYHHQDLVHSKECQKDYFGEARHTREMIYHSRLDMVLIYSMLNSLNKQVRIIVWLLAIIAITLMVK